MTVPVSMFHDHRFAWRLSALRGTGAAGWSIPLARNSSQKAAGTRDFSIRQWLAASAALRAPGMTLATTGWARQNCKAASGNATRWAAQIEESFRTRFRMAEFPN
jgi:hypothetical protein